MDVGVIGTGTMGKNHVRVYSELRNVNSLYIYDVNPEIAEKISKQFSAIPCSSAENLLKNVDAVSISVPTPFHFKLASQALAAGVHLLIEKPICSTVREGSKLLSKISDDTVVGVGHIERFNPIIPEIQRIVRNPMYVEMKRHNPASIRVTGTSVAEDLMIHDIDITFHVLFKGRYALHSVGNSDVCSALIQIGKTPVYLSASRLASKKIRSIYIEEKDFTIEGNFMTQELTVFRRPGQYAVEDHRYIQESVIETVVVNKVEPLKLELATFLSCIQKGEPFPVTPQQAVNNLKICNEIQRSYAS